MRMRSVQVGLGAHALLVDERAAREAIEAEGRDQICGSSVAMRWAKFAPEAGVALKPP